MIKAIGYQNLNSKKFSFKNNGMQKNVDIPVQLSQNNAPASYSLNNLKANYMPVNFGKEISFCGSTGHKESVPLNISMDDDGKMKYHVELKSGKVDVTAIPKARRIKGDHYSDFSKDLAVLLRANGNAILETKRGVDPEIFVHNFVNCIELGEAKKRKKDRTQVIYINNPILAAHEVTQRQKKLAAGNKYKKSKAKEFTTLEALSKLSNEGSAKKIIFINGFLEVANNISDEGNENLRECLEDSCPNTSIVGFVDNLSVDEEKGTRILEVEGGEITVDVPILKLNGLSSENAKDFFKKNPQFVDEVLMGYKEAHLQITPEALGLLVDKSAVLCEDALPDSACKMLKMIAAAKIQETESLHRKDKVIISEGDITSFFNNHSRLVDPFKPKAGTFKMAENVTTKLSDVGGCSVAKEAIQEDIIAFLKNPKKFIEERGSAPKGILLEGPPGTGKTLLARAIAGETSTPFFAVSGSQFVEEYVGVGAQRVRELFAKATEAAENALNKTAIIFVDEFDTLAKKRSGRDDGSGEADQTLNQLLTEMDGFDNKESKTRVILVAATNRKDILDEAVTRPGRFDDTINVPNPRTIAERLEILNIHARKLKFESEAEKAKILGEAAKMTDYMSGAEIMSVMKKAQKVVVKRETNKVVTHDDVVEGLLQTIAGPVQKTAEERPFEDIVCTVRHESGHATAIDFLKPSFNQKISFITLDNRGNFLGAVFHHSPHVNPNFKSVILSAATSYAGGLAEPNFKKEGYDAGIRGDLDHITDLFRKAITEWGLGIHTPPIGLISTDSEGISHVKDIFYRTMQTANQKNIEQDMRHFSETSRKIAHMINEFHTGFLDEYVERFKANAGKGGNNLSGEAFSKLRQAWLTKTGKVEAEKRLLDEVVGIVDDAYYSNKGLVERLLKKAIRTAKQAV